MGIANEWPKKWKETELDLLTTLLAKTQFSKKHLVKLNFPTKM